MKLKIVVLDFEIPPRWKRLALRVGVPFAILAGGGAIAYASVPKTWVAGETLKSADLNTNFSNLDSRTTLLEGNAHPASAFHAWMTTSTSIPSTGAPVGPVIFDHVDYDLGSEYNSVTGVFTPKAAGTYLVSCALYFNPTVAGGIYAAIVFQNSTQISTSAAPSSQALPIQPQTTNQVKLAAGDSISCSAFQNSGSSQSISVTLPTCFTSFAVARLY